MELRKSDYNYYLPEELIAQVRSKMNTMTDEQLDFTNKAISARDVGKLKTILSKCK